uniref:AMP deaminase n=1 Tax=Physcomitrium patens TaxID=3218 RepID=A0A2K1KFT6_PHYPA|nr:hypothetical protein PHYPA_009020 [Physcomitrium patens]
MRILEQVKTRLGLEELSRRRRTRRAKRIAQLCKRQDQQQQQQDEEEEEAEEEHHRLQHAVAAAGTQSQADLVTAAADNSRDSPRSSTNISNVTSSNAVNAMPILLPRVQIHCHGNDTQPSSSSATPWKCHVPTIPHSVPIIRPTTPKSPVFADMEGSDEEDHVLENEDVQNYIMDEVMGLAGVDSEAAAAHGSEHADELVSDGMVRLACGNNLLTSEPTLLRQRLKLRSHTIPGDIHSMHKPDPIAADILRKEPEQEQFIRLIVSPTEVPSMEEEEVCNLMQECLAMRAKYLFHEISHPWQSESHQEDDSTHAATSSSSSDPDPDPFRYAPEAASSHAFKMVDGVMRIYSHDKDTTELFPVHDATMFFTDMHRILRIIALGNVRTLCHRRLKLLEQKFSLHLMLNADREFLAQKSAPHRDFYNVRKVDTHVHHTSCMNQKHLLRFIKSKLRKPPPNQNEEQQQQHEQVVIFRDGKYLTLKEVFESLDLTGYDLNVDLLDVHVDKNTFHRFDKFNLKYNPCGQSRLREIFLKQDNLIQGRYLAELTKQVFLDIENSKYQMAEYRISIYGRKESEWDQLASWIVTNKLQSENVTWLIQVTVDPASHPQLHVFLKFVVGFDMVDDESKPERRPTKHMQTPAEWNNPFNPAYSYWAYYVYANLHVLNKLRESKGMTVIRFRPHSGEAGDLDHLAATFMVAHNIAHGNNLRKSPGLQYLYYLAQVGLSMSPLSNNSLFLDYHRNPFPMFFARGLNVCLSTDDPLQIHLTKEPLVEEYGIAAQVWKLSACDLCEIARNSVYQSGFSHESKVRWIGPNYYKRGPLGNDIHKTNVPHMRVNFRHEVWKDELLYVHLGEEKMLPHMQYM